MANFGFLTVLEEEMDKHFSFDYAMDWNKKNHAVELAFVLEAQNAGSVEAIDDQGELSSEDIVFEDYVLFYNPAKSTFDADNYLVTIPYDPKKGLSREFLAYFVDFLSQTAEAGLGALLDFLADPEAAEFEISWNSQAFDEGRAKLTETKFYPYPRY
ncbi:DUF3013 family protein [Streptococcus mutans]|uniref:DUF3013 family protein n=1 Tax=Streptococcus mutans TaxID=1309 RepID=UPI0002B582C7|nr:DUF3013 family protein [Streptococcus mutans]EMB70822.1 hypothetical protein SMU36_07851 [Streptococcus mutans 4VF1]EMC31623.1 hypothetical protein SMU89_07404 [Streptococcus mutans NLML1]MCB5097635.1 DUF3013 family protein [Streptococcus mutans]MCY7122715.1 DUF3013 family protein [Streptococcus mutans]NLR05594.1 DUF3013 family protein [Streptococcus mutans]